MPFRIKSKKSLQFTLRRRTVDSAKEKLKGKVLKGMKCLRAGMHQLVYCTDDWTQPKANGNVFSFNYVVKEMINIAVLQPWSYGCTWEVS